MNDKTKLRAAAHEDMERAIAALEAAEDHLRATRTAETEATNRRNNALKEYQKTLDAYQSLLPGVAAR